MTWRPRASRERARRAVRHLRRPRQLPPARHWLPIVVGLGALAVFGLRKWGPGRPESGAGGGSDSLAAVSPAAAYEAALRLSRAGRHRASLPYYRRAVAGPGASPWFAHYNYAGALYNAGLELRERYGAAVPAIRSSVERVAMMREALRELEIAERLAPSPRDRAAVIKARAERLQIWGLPWDAFVLLRQAQWSDTTNRELAGAADGYMLVLEHPEREGARPAAGPAPAR